MKDVKIAACFMLAVRRKNVTNNTGIINYEKYYENKNRT